MILFWDLSGNLDHCDNDEPHDDVDLCDFADVDLAGDEGGLGEGFGYGGVGGFGDVGGDQMGSCGGSSGSKIMSPFSIHAFQLVAGIFIMDMTSSCVNLLTLLNDCMGNSMPHPMYCPQFPGVSSVYIDWHDYCVDVNMQCISVNVT